MGLETSSDVEQIKAVRDSDGTTQPPATGAFDHAGGSDADPSGTITETLTVPDRAGTVSTLVQAADDSFTVTVKFTNTSVSYSGDGATDVDEARAVNSPDVTVQITGSATTCDYDIYIR